MPFKCRAFAVQKIKPGTLLKQFVDFDTQNIFTFGLRAEFKKQQGGQYSSENADQQSREVKVSNM